MKHFTYFALGIAIMLTACSTSQITSSWRADNVQARKYNKIMVVGLIRESDRSLREKMEEHLVGDLRQLGYNAICACDEYGSKAFENMNEKEAVDKLSNAGIDAVLTIVLLDKQKERYYIPNHIYYSPYAVNHGRFWGYYHTMYDRIYSPGYYATDTKYFWESNFYDMNTRQLVYSVQTHSFDPASTTSLAHEYGQLIVKNIVKANILLPQSPALKTF
ncbi:MAG TPA: hypothetical protein VFP87_04635 [Chitinophagaceae bacterium]|nr:hypothetical protein [Chitinophagaceae bacterium]